MACVILYEKFAARTGKENPLNYDCGDYTADGYAWSFEDKVGI